MCMCIHNIYIYIYILFHRKTYGEAQGYSRRVKCFPHRDLVLVSGPSFGEIRCRGQILSWLGCWRLCRVLECVQRRLTWFSGIFFASVFPRQSTLIGNGKVIHGFDRLNSCVCVYIVYIYIYIYMYTHTQCMISLYLSLSLSLSLSIHIYIYTHTYTHMCISICIYTHIDIHMCV